MTAECHLGLSWYRHPVGIRLRASPPSFWDRLCISQRPLGLRSPAPMARRHLSPKSQCDLPMGNQPPKTDRRLWGRCGCPHPHPSQDPVRFRRPGQPPAVRSSLVTGQPGRPVFAHKGRSGAGPRGRPSSTFLRPAAGRTIGRPLCFPGLVPVNRALLTAKTALTPKEFQKWNPVRLAWTSQAAAEAAGRGCLCGHLVGISKGTWGGLGREKGDPVNARASLVGRSPQGWCKQIVLARSAQAPAIVRARPSRDSPDPGLSGLAQHTPSCWEWRRTGERK